MAGITRFEKSDYRYFNGALKERGLDYQPKVAEIHKIPLQPQERELLGLQPEEKLGPEHLRKFQALIDNGLKNPHRPVTSEEVVLAQVFCRGTRIFMNAFDTRSRLVWAMRSITNPPAKMVSSPKTGVAEAAPVLLPVPPSPMPLAEEVPALTPNIPAAAASLQPRPLVPLVFQSPQEIGARAGVLIEETKIVPAKANSKIPWTLPRGVIEINFEQFGFLQELFGVAGVLNIENRNPDFTQAQQAAKLILTAFSKICKNEHSFLVLRSSKDRNHAETLLKFLFAHLPAESDEYKNLERWMEDLRQQHADHQVVKPRRQGGISKQKYEARKKPIVQIELQERKVKAREWFIPSNRISDHEVFEAAAKFLLLNQAFEKFRRDHPGFEEEAEVAKRNFSRLLIAAKRKERLILGPHSIAALNFLDRWIPDSRSNTREALDRWEGTQHKKLDSRRPSQELEPRSALPPIPPKPKKEWNFPDKPSLKILGQLTTDAHRLVMGAYYTSIRQSNPEVVEDGYAHHQTLRNWQLAIAGTSHVPMPSGEKIRAALDFVDRYFPEDFPARQIIDSWAISPLPLGDLATFDPALQALKLENSPDSLLLSDPDQSLEPNLKKHLSAYRQQADADHALALYQALYRSQQKKTLGLNAETFDRLISEDSQLNAMLQAEGLAVFSRDESALWRGHLSEKAILPAQQAKRIEDERRDPHGKPGR